MVSMASRSHQCGPVNIKAVDIFASKAPRAQTWTIEMTGVWSWLELIGAMTTCWNRRPNGSGIMPKIMRMPRVDLMTVMERRLTRMKSSKRPTCSQLYVTIESRVVIQME